MNVQFFKHRASVALSALACVGLLSACAGNADVVRPDAPSKSEALGETIKCTDKLLSDPNGTERFVVEWADGDRATLESEMSSGIALVEFTCDGIKVLRGCSVPGEYGYQGISKKTKSLQIADAAKAQANLSSPTLTGEVKAAFEQGRALNLGYVMVGVQKTNTPDVSKEQIKREACKRATHFVYETKVGAFAWASGEKGQAMAAAELLGYGSASGEASSSKNEKTTDGNAKDCENASKKDDEAVEGCQAVMRVSILPLAEGKVAAAKDTRAKVKDTRTCPEGFVMKDEICVQKAEAKDEAYLCKEGDEADCKTQCDKGNLGSCGRYASLIQDKLPTFGAWGDDEEELKKVIATIEKYSSLTDQFAKSCQEELEVPACEVAMSLISLADGNDGPNDADEAQRMLELATTGCEWGGTDACSFIVSAFGEGFYKDQGIATSAEKMEEIAGEGCDSGSTMTCYNLGTTFWETLFDGIKPDPKRSMKYLGKACYAGDVEGCFWAAVAYGTKDADECNAIIEENLDADEAESLLSLTMPDPAKAKDRKAFCSKVADFYDKEKAVGFADKACHLDGVMSVTTCAISIEWMDLDLDE